MRRRKNTINITEMERKRIWLSDESSTAKESGGRKRLWEEELR